MASDRECVVAHLPEHIMRLDRFTPDLPGAFPGIYFPSARAPKARAREVVQASCQSTCMHPEAEIYSLVPEMPRRKNETPVQKKISDQPAPRMHECVGNHFRHAPLYELQPSMEEGPERCAF